MEKLYLKPGTFIIKKGLSGGKLECKKSDNPLELTDGTFKLLEPNMHHFKADGRILDQKAYDKLINSTEKPKGKSEARIALEKEATEFEIEFTEQSKNKDLKVLIDAKKEELEGKSE